MTLRRRITIFVTVLFSILYAIVASTVLYFFSDFRTQEFRKRLRQKSVTTYELIQQSREKNFDFITKMNDRKEDELFNEKIYILNSSKTIVYASTILPLTYSNLLDYKILEANRVQFIQFQDHEIDISKYKTLSGDFYVIIDAQDTYGYAKLKYLISALAISFLFFAIIAFVMTGYAIAKLLEPLKIFINKIKTINENNLDESIPVKSKNNEIDLLATEFNLMLQRYEKCSISPNYFKDFLSFILLLHLLLLHPHHHHLLHPALLYILSLVSFFYQPIGKNNCNKGIVSFLICG
mgnify:CR=1 FL=1